MESMTAGSVMSVMRSRLAPRTSIQRLFKLLGAIDRTGIRKLALTRNSNVVGTRVRGQALKRFTTFCHHCDLDQMKHIAAMTQKLGSWTRITVARQIFWPSVQTILIAMAAMFVTGLSGTYATMSDAELEQLITREIVPMVDDVAGAAIAVLMDGRTRFFNYGLAERATKRPITSESLF